MTGALIWHLAPKGDPMGQALGTEGEGQGQRQPNLGAIGGLGVGLRVGATSAYELLWG